MRLRVMKRVTALLVLLAVGLACSGDKTQSPTVVASTPVIGIYVDEGAAEACVTAARNMFQWMGYPTVMIDAADIGSGALDSLSLVYFPGGWAGPYQDSLGDERGRRLRQFIEAGGAYVGVCAGGFLATRGYFWIDDQESTRNLLGIFPGRAAGPVDSIVPPPGIDMCRLDLAGEAHAITRGLPDTAWILYYTGPHFWPDSDLPIDTLATYSATGQVAIATCEYGQGRVCVIGPHPEWEEDSDRDSNSYFDDHDDRGSDWPLMKRITRWCLREL